MAFRPQLHGFALRGQYLHYIVNHRLAHGRQVMRGPGVAVGVFGVGGILGKCLGEEQQVGGLGQGVANGDAGADVKQRLV